jgi:23S rRNA pseudouridine1911/1915/1917 synthase
VESLFPILHEDKDLLVVNKPPGLVCHPTKGDAFSSLIGRIRLYLGPNAQPHMISRLDRETSGVMVVAKNVETARALCRQWELRQVRKIYLGIVRGFVKEAAGVIEAPLGKDDQSQVSIKNCVRQDGAPASTAFRVIARIRRSDCGFTLLEIEPHTGRKHQIRIHLSHIGHPIVGDKIYGGDERLYLDFVHGRLTADQRSQLILEHHALHAASILLFDAGFHSPFPQAFAHFLNPSPSFTVQFGCPDSADAPTTFNSTH